MIRFVKPYYSASTSTLKPYFLSNEATVVSDPVLSNKIKEVQKKLPDNINLDEIDAYTIELLRYAIRMEELDRNHMNSLVYLQLKGLLEQLDNNNRLLLLQNEIDRLNNLVNELQNELAECSNDGKKKFIDQEIGFNKNTEIKTEYIKYMIEYGVPEDGIFDPSKLNRIKIELGLI